jgi:methanogenic corrinoid protein MtbC1
MSARTEGPFFNLKAVVQQTGLKPDTLRAWERRYGLPLPERSAGGHRLYSQRDISILKWLIARQREGLSIKRAVGLWHQIEAEGRDPLQVATPIAMPAAPVLAPRPVGGTIMQLREAWIDACLAYDEPRAGQVINEAFALYPPETVATELLQRAVAQIGEGWYLGDVTVQQEHFCSALAIRRLEALVMAAPQPIRAGRILAACPPEENHVIGLLLITFLLRRRGWEVVYLGANVPAERLETTVTAIQPQLVIMAAQQLHTAATLTEMARILQREVVALAYGGLIFNLLPALRERIAGHFLGERLESAPEIVEELMTSPRPRPPVEEIPEGYHEALAHFQDRQGLVEAKLIQSLNGLQIPPRHLSIANRELALNIDAALSLGNMDYLGTDMRWIANLLENREMPSGMLYDYLEAYHQAAEEQLDDRAEPILTWLENMIQENGQTGSREIL